MGFLTTGTNRDDTCKSEANADHTNVFLCQLSFLYQNRFGKQIILSGSWRDGFLQSPNAMCAVRMMATSLT